MAHDEALARALREAARAALEDVAGLEERPTPDGLIFFYRGRIICGVRTDAFGGGVMFCVGPAGEAEALALPGTRRLFRPRPMSGYVEVTAPPGLTPGVLAWLMDLSLENACTQPPE